MTDTTASAKDLATIRALIQTDEFILKHTKRGYYAEPQTATYEDMRAAAQRLLEARAYYERQSGRKVTTKVTPAAISALIR